MQSVMAMITLNQSNKVTKHMILAFVPIIAVTEIRKVSPLRKVQFKNRKYKESSDPQATKGMSWINNPQGRCTQYGEGMYGVYGVKLNRANNSANSSLASQTSQGCGTHNEWYKDGVENSYNGHHSGNQDYQGECYLNDGHHNDYHHSYGQRHDGRQQYSSANLCRQTNHLSRVQEQMPLPETGRFGAAANAPEISMLGKPLGNGSPIYRRA